MAETTKEVYQPMTFDSIRIGLASPEKIREWYLKAIPLGGVQPIYINLDVTFFDMTGVSESNTAYWKVERRPILEREVPPMILADYDRYASDMYLVDRLRKHHLYGVVRFMERVLFKLEKWHILKK